jgi:hypothetical protein
VCRRTFLTSMAHGFVWKEIEERSKN